MEPGGGAAATSTNSGLGVARRGKSHEVSGAVMWWRDAMQRDVTWRSGVTSVTRPLILGERGARRGVSERGRASEPPAAAPVLDMLLTCACLYSCRYDGVVCPCSAWLMAIDFIVQLRFHHGTSARAHGRASCVSFSATDGDIFIRYLCRPVFPELRGPSNGFGFIYLLITLIACLI